MTGPGRAAWRVWLPPLLVTMIMVTMVSYQDGRPRLAPGGIQLALIFVSGAALLFRFRGPLPVAAVTVAAGVLLPLTANHRVLVDVAAVVALYTVGLLRGRRTAWTAGVLAAMALTGASAPWQPGGMYDLANLVPANYVLIAVAVGDAVRNRRALLAEVQDRAALAERTREQEARRRVHDERVRIARDLHDVVAHHITLVNAQAGVAHHLMPTHPDKAREALAGIRDTSRAALDELRATVGLLRQDDDPPDSRQPSPGVAAVDDLLDGFRRAGYDIRVARTGTAVPLPGNGGVAAYRIVREALTNAGKHGTARYVLVSLDYTTTALRISVVNPARPGHRGEGTGHGLVGMRERAEAAGGTLACGMRPDGTYEVRASLPTRAGVRPAPRCAGCRDGTCPDCRSGAGLRPAPRA